MSNNDIRKPRYDSNGHLRALTKKEKKSLINSLPTRNIEDIFKDNFVLDEHGKEIGMKHDRRLNAFTWYPKYASPSRFPGAEPFKSTEERKPLFLGHRWC